MVKNKHKPLGHVQRSYAHNKSAANVLAALGIMTIALENQQEHVITNALATHQGPGRGLGQLEPQQLGDNQLIQLQELTHGDAKTEDVDTSSSTYKDAIAKTLALMKKNKGSQGSQSLPQMQAASPSPSNIEAQAMQTASRNVEDAVAPSLPLSSARLASQSESQALAASDVDKQASISAADQKSRKQQIRKARSKGQEFQGTQENAIQHSLQAMEGLQAPNIIESIKDVNQAQKDIDTSNQPNEQASVDSSSALASSTASAQAQNTASEKELPKSGLPQQQAKIPTQQLSDKATDEEVAAALSSTEVKIGPRGQAAEQVAQQPSLPQSGPNDQTQTQTLQSTPQDSIAKKANSKPKKQGTQSTADVEEKRQERSQKLFENAVSTRISTADLEDAKTEEAPQSTPQPILEEEGESSYSLAARLASIEEAKARKREQQQEKQARQGSSTKKAATSGKEKTHPGKSQKSKEELAEKQQNTDNNNEANLPLEKSESKSDKADAKMALSEEKESKMAQNEKIETKSQIIVGNDVQNLEKAGMNEQMGDIQNQIMSMASGNGQTLDLQKSDDLQNLLKNSNESDISSLLGQSLGQMKLSDLKALQQNAGLDPDQNQQEAGSLSSTTQSVVGQQNESVAPQPVLAPQAEEAPQAAAAPQAIEQTPAPIPIQESKSDQQLAIEHTIALIRAKALNQKLEAESKAQNLVQAPAPKLEPTQPTGQTQSSPKLSQDQLRSIVQAAVQKNAKKAAEVNQAPQPYVQAQQMGIQAKQVQQQIKTNESRNPSKQASQQLEQTASEASIRQEPRQQLQQVPSQIRDQDLVTGQPIQPSAAVLAPTAPNTQSAQQPTKNKIDTEKLKLLIKRISAQKQAQQADDSIKQAQMNPDVAKVQVQTDGIQIMPDDIPITQPAKQQQLSTKDIQTQMQDFLSQSNQRHAKVQKQSTSASGTNSAHQVIKQKQQHSKSNSLEKHAKTAVNKKQQKNKKSQAKQKNQKVISLKQIDTKKEKREAQAFEAKTVALTQNGQYIDGPPSKSPEEEYARKTAHLLNRANQDLTMSDQDIKLDNQIISKLEAQQSTKNGLKTAIKQNIQKKEQNKTKKQIISLKAKDVRNVKQEAKMPQTKEAVHKVESRPSQQLAGGCIQPEGCPIEAQGSDEPVKQQVSQKQSIVKSPEEFAPETQQQRKEIQQNDNSGSNLQREGLATGDPARPRSGGCIDPAGCPIGSQGANWPYTQQVSQSVPQETKKAFENKETISEQNNPSTSQQDEIVQGNQLSQPRAISQQKEQAAESTLVGQQTEVETSKLHQLNTQASSYKDLIAKTIALAKKQGRTDSRQPVASLAEKQNQELAGDQAGKVIVKQAKNSFRRGPPASRLYLQINENHKLQQKGKFIQDWDEEKQEFTDTDEVRAEGDMVLHTVKHMFDPDHIDLEPEQARWLNKQEPRIDTGAAKDAKTEMNKHTDKSDSKGVKLINQANEEKSRKLTGEAPVKAQNLPQTTKDDAEAAHQHSTSGQKGNQEAKVLNQGDSVPSYSKDIPDIRAQQKNMNEYLDSVNDNDDERNKEVFDHKDHDHKDQDGDETAEKNAEEMNSSSGTSLHVGGKEYGDGQINSKESTKDTDSDEMKSTPAYEMDSHDGGEGEARSQTTSKESSSSTESSGNASVEELLRSRHELLRREGADREKELKIEYQTLANEKAHLKLEVDHAIAVRKAAADIRAEKERRQAARERGTLNADDFKVETDLIRDALRGLEDEDETSLEKYKEKRALPRPESAPIASHVEEKDMNKKPTGSAANSEAEKATKPNGASPVVLTNEKQLESTRNSRENTEAHTQHTSKNQSEKMDHLEDKPRKEEVKEEKSASKKKENGDQKLQAVKISAENKNEEVRTSKSQEDQANKNKEQQAKQIGSKNQSDSQKQKDSQKDKHAQGTTVQTNKIELNSAVKVNKQASVPEQHLQDKKPHKEDQKPKSIDSASSSQSANKNGSTQKQADKSKAGPPKVEKKLEKENKNVNTSKGEQAGKKQNDSKQEKEREQRSEQIHQQVQQRLKEDHKTGIIFSIQNGIQNMFSNAWNGIKWIFAHF